LTSAFCLSSSIHINILLSFFPDAARHQVAFHAVDLSPWHYTSSTPLIFSHVILNTGNGYDSSTGLFRAPHPGLYCFLATTGGHPASSHGGAYHSLYVDNTIVANGYTYWYGTHIEQVTVHAVLHLQTGQTVHVRAQTGDIYIDDDRSMFSGFLLSHDF
jgi:hypothetical protein